MKQKAQDFLPMLRQICLSNSEITGDLIYDSLLNSGVAQNTIYLYSGPLIKIGVKNQLLIKTERCFSSKRNRASLQRIWKSLIFKK